MRSRFPSRTQAPADSRGLGSSLLARLPLRSWHWPLGQSLKTGLLPQRRSPDVIATALIGLLALSGLSRARAITIADTGFPLDRDATEPATLRSQAGASGNSPVSAHLSSAQKALEARDFARAKAELNLALQADPRSAEAYLMLGTVDMASGNTAAAIEHYQRVLKLKPDSFRGHYNLGMAYLRDHNLRAGRAELERATDLNPRDADAAYNLGVVLLELQKPRDAVSYLHRAKALGPDRPDVAFNLVRAELAAGDPGQARLDARDEAKSFGRDAQWNASIGRLFLESGSPQDAAFYLQAALDLDRTGQASLALRRDLALAFVESKEPDSALALIKNPATAEDHYLRASAYYVMHRLADAQQELVQSLDQAPREPRYLLLSARIHQHLGEHAKAHAQLEEVTRLAPKWSEPYYSTAVSYYFERRYADARRSLDQALQLDPRSARALFLDAATLVNEGRNREAEDALRRAIAVEPDNARFEYHLGAILVRDNRPAEAEQAFGKAVGLKPDYALPHYQLGKILVRQGQLAAAAQELEKAVRQQPDLAQAYYQLSRVYAQRGEREKSARALETFNSLKNREVSEDQELLEDLNRELRSP